MLKTEHSKSVPLASLLQNGSAKENYNLWLTLFPKLEKR